MYVPVCKPYNTMTVFCDNFFICGIVYICIVSVVNTFNVEELKWINYEVDISVTPVRKEEINQQAVYITSRNGQEFQCILPQLNEEEMSEKEVVHEKDTDVIELLKPMKSASCLSKGKDWWTYEFCFGHYIKQFHVEDGEIIGQVITLGLYESDYDWNNETDQDKFRHSKQKYHSQYYTNGTKCDLTGQPRNAEVRFFCEEDAGDYIYRVDEPGTCSYIITVHTSRLCSHPLLKPLPSNKAHSITCNPLLNEEQYNNYLQKLKEEKAIAEAKRSQWLTNQQERLQVMKSENQLPIDDKTENIQPEDAKLLLKYVTIMPMKENYKTENMPLEDSKSSLKSAKIKPIKENQKVTENMQTDDSKPLLKSAKIVPMKENYEKVRTFLLEEYNKEMEKLKSSLPPEKFASVKNDFEKQFDAILDQARDDFDSDLSEEAKDVSLGKLT